MDESLPAEILVVRVRSGLLWQGSVDGGEGAGRLVPGLPGAVDGVVVDQVGAGRSPHPRILKLILNIDKVRWSGDGRWIKCIIIFYRTYRYLKDQQQLLEPTGSYMFIMNTNFSQYIQHNSIW